MISDTSIKKDGPIYEESIEWGCWYKITVLIGSAFIIAGSIAMAFTGNLIMFIVYFVLAIVVLLVFANFWRLEFKITDDRVSFGFGVLGKSFPRSKIISCEPYDIRFRNYLGYGLRLGRDRTIAYDTRGGRGVKITVEDQKKPYVISVNDPGLVCQMLGSSKPNAENR